MGENFSINDNNEFKENSEGSIKIDGMLSAEEKAEFQDAFACDCGKIRDETNGKLADLLQTDVLPNLDTSGLSYEMQEQIRLLDNKYNSHIHISPKGSAEISDALSPFNMQIEDKISSYNNYINSELVLPSNSDISRDEHRTMISKIGDHISDTSLSIPQLVAEAREKYSSLSDREVVGIINDKIESGFKYVKECLLPNAKLTLASSAPGFFENAEDIFYQRALDGGFRDNQIDQRSEIALMRFKSEVGELRNCLTGGEDINNIPDIYNGWGDIGELIDPSFGLQSGITEIQESSFLSPEDAEKYTSAKIRAAIFMVIQILPLGVTDLVSMGIDISDVFSSTDSSFDALKNLNVIDQDIHVGKEWWERGLSFVGALGGIVGADTAIKGNRALSMLSDMGLSKSDLLSEVDDFGTRLGLSPENTGALRRGISNFGQNRQNAGFMNIARTNGRLSDVPGTDTFILGDISMSVSSREFAFLNRLQEGHTMGEVPMSLDTLNQEQIRNMLDVINNMHFTHADQAIGTHSFGQIKDKLQIARDNGIPTFISRIAVLEGYAGVSDSYAGVRSVLNIRDAAKKSAEDIFKLIGEHLPDNIDLFELEEVLGIGNQKLIEFVQSQLGNRINESNIVKTDLLTAIRANNETPEFDFLTADITGIINKLRNSNIELSTMDQTKLRDFMDIYKSRPQADIHTYIILHKIFQESDLNINQIAGLLAEISGGRKGDFLRMSQTARRQRQTAHSDFIESLAGSNGSDFGLSTIQTYLDSQSEIKTFSLNVGEEAFEHLISDPIKAKRIAERLRELIQEHGSDLYISRNL